MKPSSRAVGEPGTGAYVAKDPSHCPVILSLRQDRLSLASVSGCCSLLDGMSAIVVGSIRRNQSHQYDSSRASSQESHSHDLPRSIVTLTPPAARPCVRASCLATERGR